eukprot:6208916-Pleurochrysis_carterae.AAC.2
MLRGTTKFASLYVPQHRFGCLPPEARAGPAVMAPVSAQVLHPRGARSRIRPAVVRRASHSPGPAPSDAVSVLQLQACNLHPQQPCAHDGGSRSWRSIGYRDGCPAAVIGKYGAELFHRCASSVGLGEFRYDLTPRQDS